MLGASCPTDKPCDATKRSEFGMYGCQVFGWPSSGGVLIKDPDNAVDLEYLGIERLNATSRSDSTNEEDAFCERPRKLGATWWASEEDYINVLLGLRERTPLEHSELVVGWPASGGAWILRFENAKQRPKDFGKIKMALNMEERCRVVEEYGGTFYTDLEKIGEMLHTS